MSLESPQLPDGKELEPLDLQVEAKKIEGRLIEFLGAFDHEKGMEIWKNEGYRDVFKKHLGNNPEFDHAVLGGYMVTVLNILEGNTLAQGRVAAERAKRLEEEMRSMQSRYPILRHAALVFALGSTSYSAVKIARSKWEKVSPVESAPEALVMEELRELDPEATPERLHLILSTLPGGFVEGDVASIGFRDKKYKLDKSYGEELHRNAEGAATAEGGHGTSGTRIVFWRGMKGHPSMKIWNGTLLHEVAHANDWRTDSDLSSEDRTALKAAVMARVAAEDRFKSPYVEAISNNDDDAQELETKAVEYWAEIVEEYLKGGVLPEADEELVQKHIAKQDPDFDREAELQARLGVLVEMQDEEDNKRMP
ncbi:MAG: hypothetical protein WC866_05260 [Patescibacteria group bacterium]|jgi:hypothetical protein